ncbi:MAG: cell division protein SepF [Armatimonadetes bacterium]|nr:cell division protein SepF [Armatimonadota bacterium]
MSGLLDRVRSWLFAEDDYDGPAPGEEEDAQVPQRRRGALIKLHSRSGEIFIRRPRDQDEARICVDCLRGRRAVVVNLKEVKPDHALRVFDFLAGATYALGGQLEQAGDGVYLVTPQNIGIMAEEEEGTGTSPESSFWQEI